MARRLVKTGTIALLAGALAVPSLPAIAEVKSAPGMLADASNAIMPAADLNLGFGGFSTAQVAASMNCTTANGSTAVTGCDSTAGLAAGQFVTGPGIAAGTTVAGSITSTGFTLSAAAGSGAGTGLLSARGPFWSDVDGGSPNIWRIAGRVAIGNAAGLGTTRTDANETFCQPTAHCATWLPRDTSLLAMSPVGGTAIAGMSEGSLGTGLSGGIAPIGVAGLVINDNSALQSAWAGYFEDQHQVNNTSWGIEVVAKNESGVNAIAGAYSGAGGADGIRLTAGGDPSYGGAPTNPSDAAIHIATGVGNAGNYTNYTWNRGIVFGNNAITGTDGTTGTGIAIEMARGQTLQWDEPGSGTAAASIWSAGSTLGHDMGLQFLDDTVRLVGTGYSIVADFDHVANGVNYIATVNSATGNAPTLRATGSDADIGLNLQPKGTGTVKVSAGGVQLPVYTVATLPACGAGNAETMAAVSDATAPTYNGALTGGGAVTVPVFCNGTSWTAH